MPLAVTVLEDPTPLVSKVGVPLTVSTSPTIRSSAYVTEAVVVPSYTLFDAVIVTFNDFAVMFADVVAVVLAV